LILVVVLLFSCFPKAFAESLPRLHIPLTLMLIGIVLRGSAFAFRAHTRDGAMQLHWGRVFPRIASARTSLYLGLSRRASPTARARRRLPKSGVARWRSRRRAPNELHGAIPVVMRPERKGGARRTIANEHERQRDVQRGRELGERPWENS